MGKNDIGKLKGNARMPLKSPGETGRRGKETERRAGKVGRGDPQGAEKTDGRKGNGKIFATTRKDFPRTPTMNR